MDSSEGIERLLRVEKIELVYGRAIIVVVRDVESSFGQSLQDYVRDQIASSMGWIMPDIKVSYSILLEQFSCQLKINGQIVAQTRILPHLSLAINHTPLEGIVECLDAGDIFEGYCCAWIDSRMVYKVIKQKGKILSSADAFVKWLLYTISGNIQDLFGFEELQTLIDFGNRLYPATLNAAVKTVGMPAMLKVFRNLLEDGVSVKPLESIFTSIAIHGYADCDSDHLTEQVRLSVCNSICLPLTCDTNCIYVISIHSELEDRLIKQDYTNDIAGQPFAGELASSILAAVDEVTDSGFLPVILTNAGLRSRLSSLLRKNHRRIHVLASSEIPRAATVETLYTIKPLKQKESIYDR